MQTGESRADITKPVRTPPVDPNDIATWPGTPRNALCPCGSGKKYKHCHARNARRREVVGGDVGGDPQDKVVAEDPFALTLHLQQEVVELGKRENAAIAECNEWKRRAEIAETKLMSVQHLHELVANLVTREQTAMAEAERWKREAQDANVQVTKLANAASKLNSATERDSFDQLRRFLAKEFHPDHNFVEGLEKSVRTEVFKIIWPKIDSIMARR